MAFISAMLRVNGGVHGLIDTSRRNGKALYLSRRGEHILWGNVIFIKENASRKSNLLTSLKLK